jgi:hypothetical protein
VLVRHTINRDHRIQRIGPFEYAHHPVLGAERELVAESTEQPR